MSIIDQVCDETRSPVVVAELSANHNGSMERALQIIDEASRCGAHAIKFQTYTADSLTIDSTEQDFIIDDPSSLWFGRNLYDLYGEGATPYEWHEALFSRARSLGLEPFSTPFDEKGVEFLMNLGVSCFKIASFENSDLPLLRCIASTRKPVIISSGMASMDDLGLAVETLRDAGASQIVVLKCTSAYPAPFNEMNLSQIPEIKKQFGVYVGVSDHSPGSTVPVTAVAMGARLVEKHLTLRRSDGGLDSAFSMEPAEFKQLVSDVFHAWESLGKTEFHCGVQESKSKKFRRSVYCIADIASGEQFTKENVSIIRPGYGLEPKYFSYILGKTAARDLRRGTAVTWVSVKDGAPDERG